MCIIGQNLVSIRSYGHYPCLIFQRFLYVSHIKITLLSNVRGPQPPSSGLCVCHTSKLSLYSTFRRLFLPPSPGICVTHQDEFGIQYFGDFFAFVVRGCYVLQDIIRSLYMPHIRTKLVCKVSEVLCASIFMDKKIRNVDKH
jgi:hypothetical protein